MIQKYFCTEFDATLRRIEAETQEELNEKLDAHHDRYRCKIFTAERNPGAHVIPDLRQYTPTPKPQIAEPTETEKAIAADKVLRSMGITAFGGSSSSPSQEELHDREAADAVRATLKALGIRSPW